MVGTKPFRRPDMRLMEGHAQAPHARDGLPPFLFRLRGASAASLPLAGFWSKDEILGQASKRLPPLLCGR